MALVVRVGLSCSLLEVQDSGHLAPSPTLPYAEGHE